MKIYQTLIGGAWVDARGGDTFETHNPFTAQPWARIPRCGAQDVNRAVAAAKTAFESGAWASATPTMRGAMLRRPKSQPACRARSLRPCSNWAESRPTSSLQTPICPMR
ncbi:aldehyde dehydrogenase family protein [Paraburkholderia polaris]|uniref:aldehyde dehydrogenase family protein n=1 Tax=Paraburkholderia polaris TaxID=2728848 RepID=UPI002E3010B8|nr:aldehyde dehydrogenase family protein [Paraburkholderia polaris]